jgi:hypothetical protein
MLSYDILVNNALHRPKGASLAFGLSVSLEIELALLAQRKGKGQGRPYHRQ